MGMNKDTMHSRFAPDGIAGALANVHTQLDVRQDPIAWSPAHNVGATDIDQDRLDELEIQGEMTAIDNALARAGVPRTSKDGRILKRDERVEILAAWAARGR